MLAVAERYGWGLIVRDSGWRWVSTNPPLDCPFMFGFDVPSEFMLSSETLWFFVALCALRLRMLWPLILDGAAQFGLTCATEHL